MKKLLCMLLALLAIGSCAFAETENAADEAVLNIFTWEGYIDYETVIKPFEQETGIKVNYATFSSNEEMYEKALRGKRRRLRTWCWPATTYSTPPAKPADAAVRRFHRG